MMYLNAGVPVTLSTDDQGLELTDLNHEYYLAATRYKLPYSVLKDIDRNSLSYSFLPGKQLWQKRGSYQHLTQACVQDNPYSANTPSASCRAFLDANLKAKLEWNLEQQFAKFERSMSVSS